MLFGIYFMVCCFFKGVFELKFFFFKYKNIWDVNIVLVYLLNFYLFLGLILKDFIFKMIMFLVLLLGQRCQILYLFFVSNMVLKDDSCVFIINKFLKIFWLGKYVLDLIFIVYLLDNCLCFIVCLFEYVKRISYFRKGSDQLLVSF